MPARSKEPKMTAEAPEQPTTSVEASNPFIVDAPYAVDLTGVEDDTTAQLWALVKADEPSLWAHREKIDKMQPPTTAEILDILKNDENAEIAERRSAIAALREQLENAENEAHEFILSGIQSVPKEEFDAEVDAFRRGAIKLKSVVSLAEQMASTLGHNDIADAIKLYKLPTLRGATPRAASSTTGASRPQVKAVKISNAGDGRELRNLTEDKAKLSFAATYMKTETSEVMAAWLAASGKTTWQEIKDVVSFTVGNFQLEVTPK